MKKKLKMIRIEVCKKKNLKKLMRFLHVYWKKNHVLAKNHKLIKWQHFSKKENHYNFVIALYNSQIIGCLGFIKNSLYSKKLINNETIWLVNWIVIKKNLLSGLQLISYLLNNCRYKKIGTVGGNYKTHQILKALGFNGGLLKHYYVINPEIKKFMLVQNPKKKFIKKKNSFNVKTKIELIKNTVNFKIFGNRLKALEKKFGKDQTYFINRYFKHPYYQYSAYKIESKKRTLGIFVTRICKHKNQKALRIVDFFGFDKALINIAEPLQFLLIKINAEYTDLYLHDIKKKILFKSGLLENNYDDRIIIPSNFEPFKRKNIYIRWSVKSKNKLTNPIFKADCDQDRPSII